MKLLLVSDTPNSALSIAARTRARLLPSDLVYASSFASPNKLLSYIAANKYEGIMFTWRGALKDGLQIPSFRKNYLDLLRTSSVHCLIPDFLGLNPRFIEGEGVLLNSVHGYWVTCQELQSEYKKQFPEREPLGIIHDLPDTKLISTFSSVNKETKVVWVGNSKWGERFGFEDHKGLNRFVKPLMRQFSHSNPEVKFRILDSSREKLPNVTVLEEINSARVLLQASDSEGTGLPILEALGLGVVPVTTNVGIAHELLSGDLEQFICNRNQVDMERKINKALAFDDLDLLKSTYDSFVRLAESEKISWNRSEIVSHQICSNRRVVARILVIWLYRFLVNFKRRSV